jgi:hypothetical protein
MIVASPTPFHTSTRAMDSRAYDGSVSQAGPEMPTAPRDWLMIPRDGFISTWKVMPTPMALTSTGKNITERRKSRPTIRDVSSTASSMPMTTFAPDVTTP